MKKKVLSFVLTMLLVTGLFSINAKAETLSADVFVTIANGSLVMVQEKITVTDIDADNKLTVNDALYCAHEAKYTGGAATGYASEVSAWGLSLTKLWGVVNGGSYGYYVNDTASNGLADEVKAGDYVAAFVYTDLSAWSDSYSYFDVKNKEVKAGEEFTLTLTMSNFNGSAPVANATILVDGAETAYKTDAEGKVTLKLNEVKNCLVSAKSDEATLVPPVCMVKVTAATPQTGEGNTVIFVLGAVLLLGTGLVVSRRKISYEK